MKPVALGPEPEVLASFRATHVHGTWGEFRNQPGSEAVFDRLAVAQGFICAYCEIEIRRPIYGQVEHFEPKSKSTPTRNLHLEFENLFACCEGGTWPFDSGRAEPPITETRHCGSLKGDQSPKGRMLNPRNLRAAGRIWRFASSGKMIVDASVCTTTGIDPGIAQSTVEFLGLNRRVLTRLRRAVIEDLDAHAFSNKNDGFDDASRLLGVAAEQILADERGRLVPFWSTVRDWAGPSTEACIEGNRQRIPGFED